MGYLISIDTTLKLIQDFRRNDKNVVFTHGSFDLFHAGHSLFLNKSKKEVEVLIVGLEPDSNIKKYKGKLRPIINQNHRAEILINHKAVDFVFLNYKLNEMNDLYYIELYKLLKPNIITVGKGFPVKNREDLKLRYSTVREMDAEVTSTTKIITAIINSHNVNSKSSNS